MMLDGTRLEELWRAAAARPSTSGFRTAAVGAEVAHGPVLAGVDRSGRRCLLVPISPRHTLKEDLEGRAVTLARRALEDEQSFHTYACLELADPRLGDLFTALCLEVVERVAATPDRAVAALRKVMADWRALLAGAREALAPSALAGLFGELHVLRELLDSDPGAVAYWTGPTGSAQDFHRGADAIEVKTTVSPEGRQVRVNGLYQLDVRPSGRLVLRWLRLRTDRGLSVPELVDAVLAETDDPQTFRSLLFTAGYHEAEREIYTRRRFEVIEDRAYEVGPGFPRVVPPGLTGDATLAGVDHVEYQIDLDSAAAEARRLDQSALDHFMGCA